MEEQWPERAWATTGEAGREATVAKARRRAVSSRRLRPGVTECIGGLDDACEVSCRVRAVRWPGRSRGFTPRTTWCWCRPEVGPPLLLLGRVGARPPEQDSASRHGIPRARA